MCCIISSLPNWIQAISALCLVSLTLLTLLILQKYAADTKRIADVSASQTENSQMPFLAVAMREGDNNRQGGWVVHNQGLGPALNISYSVYDNNGVRSMRSMPPLGREDKRENLHNEIANAIGRGNFEMKYESLSGLTYGTTIETVQGIPRTKFHRPDPPGCD